MIDDNQEYRIRTQTYTAENALRALMVATIGCVCHSCFNR